MDERCEICGGVLTWKHDHRADNSGIDDGPPIDIPRKKPAPKSPDVMREIRFQAWETRRKKYGPHGHR